MRVLFLTKYYPPSKGGIERYGHMLCTALASRGCRVEVIAAAEAGEPECEEVVDGVKVYRLRSHFHLSSTPITLALPGLVRRIAHSFDIIHINFPNPWTDILYLLQCAVSARS